MSAIVIDNGSFRTRAGFAGDSTPQVVLPTVAGRPRGPRLLAYMMNTPGLKTVYVGKEALAKRGIMRIKRPIEEGVITNWDDMEEVWRSIFIDHEYLRVSPEEHAILVTESVASPPQNREKMAQVMFELFTAPALAIRTTAELALLASGRKTGVVIEFGHDATHVVPVHDGVIVKEAVCRLDVGGIDLTEYFIKLLMEERGYCLTTSHERRQVEEMKERLAYVALDFDEDMLKAAAAGPNGEQQFEIQTGNDTDTYKVGTELFRVPEALFKPTLIESESQGIHRLILDAILKCDSNIQSQMWSNVVLAGGMAMLPGLADRISRELRSHVPTATALKITTPEDGSTSAWLGGSLMAEAATQDIWWTLEDYTRVGPSVVHSSPAARCVS
ncbi:hypothetical protein PHLGIDRAFT_145302 [Phlebiopsis gigantea 11061_1 CR5-6]|uniref:Actin-related protein n=1 Tax=Phlebiopsis gigantea (strain 11061_1 CR5-6) TaxID=745531 RepID=A0A0C3RVZ8_PHLG1|nr:hypothetical protein PHLGIDRAFT_145302 [Phlebiopsis gigantea 11061_1 CR5-6]